jgi:hypothetical protein
LTLPPPVAPIKENKETATSSANTSVHPAPSQTESPFSSESVTSVHNISELDGNAYAPDDDGGGDSGIENSNGSSDDRGDGEDDNNDSDYLPYHKDSTKVPEDADKNSTLPAELRLPPSPFNSVVYFADERPYLVRVNGSYMWHDERHRCTHKDEITTTESSLVDSTCCVLSFFDGMYYSRALGSIICPYHDTLVAFEDLEKHVTVDHTTACKCAGFSIPHLLKHISHNLGIPDSQSREMVLRRISENPPSSPIPGLTLPVKCIRCPNCHEWYKTGRTNEAANLQKHWTSVKRRDGSQLLKCREWYSKNTAQIRPETLLRLYASTLFRSGKKSSSSSLHRVPYAVDYCPPDGESLAEVEKVRKNKYPPATKQFIVSPEFITNFGWKSYIESLQADRSALIQLIAMPSNRMAEHWPKGSEGRHIEEGLIVLHRFVVTYMQDANTRVNGSHKSIRRAIRPE